MLELDSQMGSPKAKPSDSRIRPLTRESAGNLSISMVSPAGRSSILEIARLGFLAPHPMKTQLTRKRTRRSRRIDISLTDFVDFTTKNGKPRLTLVKEIRNRGKYDPKHDFWRTVREGIIEFHRTGDGNKADLDVLGTGQTHKPKKTAYPIVIKAYQKFLGRKSIEWFEPDRANWSSNGLTVRVNPELGLEINGVSHLIKLYFKDEGLTKRKVDMILHLMDVSLGERPEGTKLALLDVRNAKLYADDMPDPDLQHLLSGEAAAFAAMWRSLALTPRKRRLVTPAGLAPR